MAGNAASIDFAIKMTECDNCLGIILCFQESILFNGFQALIIHQ